MNSAEINEKRAKLKQEYEEINAALDVYMFSVRSRADDPYYYQRLKEFGARRQACRNAFRALPMLTMDKLRILGPIALAVLLFSGALAVPSVLLRLFCGILVILTAWFAARRYIAISSI